jgi:hypothetical protein
VTFGGFLLAGESLTMAPLRGVVLVVIGIMSLALGKERAGTKSILLRRQQARSSPATPQLMPSEKVVCLKAQPDDFHHSQHLSTMQKV